MLYYAHMKRPITHFSPIAVMIRIYHDRYHLNYVHAKKLFVFDIMLLLGTLFLMVATVLWKTYDPTITNYVQLNIAAYTADGTPLSRISSGEPVTYIITYQNTSDVIMERPQILLTLPQFFDITDIRSTNSAYDAQTSKFALPDLRPNDTGTIEVEGVYFGTPDVYEDVQVSLSYVQAGRTNTEVRHARIISSLRDAVLVASLTGAETIRANGTFPITLTLTNSGVLPLDNIILSTSTAYGTITWDTLSPLPQLGAYSSTTVQGIFTADIKDTNINNISIAVTPALIRAGSVVPQDTVQLSMTVVHPSVRIESATIREETAQGGDTITLSVEILNTGDSLLEDVTLVLPLSASTINIVGSRALSAETIIRENELIRTISPSLNPKERILVEIPLLLQAIPQGGTDMRLSLTPRVRATALGSTTPLQTELTTNPIAIGTSLIVQAESRYYTNEGDQLGRGALPPTVGQETKYWAFITLQNTTSQVSSLRVNGTLGETVSWTGRTSVSAGNDITYTATNRTWQYTLPNLAPYQTVGIYMELAITPTESMRGTIPVLLQNISVQGQDEYIDEALTKSISRIDASLPNDTRGNALGITVQ
jgi:hypothetical protein